MGPEERIGRGREGGREGWDGMQFPMGIAACSV